MNEFEGASSGVDIKPLVVMISSDDIEKRFTKIDNYSIEILDAISKLKLTADTDVANIIKKALSNLQDIDDPKYAKIETMLNKLMNQYQRGNGSNEFKGPVLEAITYEDFNQLSLLIKKMVKKCEELDDYEKKDDFSQHVKLDKIIELLMAKNIIQKQKKVPAADQDFFDKLGSYLRKWQQIPIDAATRTFEQVKGVCENVGGLILSTSEEDKKRDSEEKKEIEKLNKKVDDLMAMVAKLSNKPGTNDDDKRIDPYKVKDKDTIEEKIDPVKPPFVPTPEKKEPDIPIKEARDKPLIDDKQLDKQLEIKKERTLSEGIEINEIKKYVDLMGHADNQDNSFFKVNVDQALYAYNNDANNATYVNSFFNIKSGDADINTVVKEFKNLTIAGKDIRVSDNSSTSVITPMSKKELQELTMFHLLTVNDMKGTMKYSNTITRLYSIGALTQAFPLIASIGDIRSSYVLDSLGESNNNYMNKILSIISEKLALRDSNSLCVPFRNFGLRGLYNQASLEYGSNMKLFASGSSFENELEYYLAMTMFMKFINPYTTFDSLEAFRSLWSLDLDYNVRKTTEPDSSNWIKGGIYPILSKGTLSEWVYGVPPRTKNFNHVTENMKENRGSKGYTPWFNSSLWPVNEKNMMRLSSRNVKVEDVGSVIEILGAKIDYKQSVWLGDLKKLTSISRIINIKERLPQIMCGLASHYYTCKRVRLNEVFTQLQVPIDEVAHNLEAKLYEVKTILFNSSSPKDLLLPKNLPSLGSKKIVAL